MSNYKGHLAGGLVTALALVYIMSWWFEPTIMLATQLIVCALFGSLFPDIDTKSQGQLLSYRFLAVLLMVLVAQQRFQLALFCSAVGILPLVVHHRGLFHRVWFLAAICMSAVLYTSWYVPQYTVLVALHSLFFFMGALSHLWLDFGIKRMMKS